MSMYGSIKKVVAISYDTLLQASMALNLHLDDAVNRRNDYARVAGRYPEFEVVNERDIDETKKALAEIKQLLEPTKDGEEFPPLIIGDEAYKITVEKGVQPAPPLDAELARAAASGFPPVAEPAKTGIFASMAANSPGGGDYRSHLTGGKGNE